MGFVVQRENVGRKRFRRLLHGSVQTCAGPAPARSHLKKCVASRGASFAYVCLDCGRLTCGCNGGGDDARCDVCVVGVDVTKKAG